MPSVQASAQLPQLVDLSPGGIQTWANQLIGALQSHFAAVNSPSGGGAWTLSNVTPDRTFDPTVSTDTYTGQALGTLIQDLIAGGVVASTVT